MKVGDLVRAKPVHMTKGWESAYAVGVVLDIAEAAHNDDYGDQYEIQWLHDVSFWEEHELILISEGADSLETN